MELKKIILRHIHSEYYIQSYHTYCICDDQVWMRSFALDRTLETVLSLKRFYNLFFFLLFFFLIFNASLFHN